MFVTYLFLVAVLAVLVADIRVSARHRARVDGELMELRIAVRALTREVIQVTALLGLVDEPAEFTSLPIANTDRLRDVVLAMAGDGMGVQAIAYTLSVPEEQVSAIVAAGGPAGELATQWADAADATRALIAPVDPLTNWEAPLLAEDTGTLPVLAETSADLPDPTRAGRHRAPTGEPAAPGEPGAVACPICEVGPGQPCVYVISRAPMDEVLHWGRYHAAGQRCPEGCSSCPTVYEAPAPGAVTGEGDDPAPARPQLWAGLGPNGTYLRTIPLTEPAHLPTGGYVLTIDGDRADILPADPELTAVLQPFEPGASDTRPAPTDLDLQHGPEEEIGEGDDDADENG